MNIKIIEDKLQQSLVNNEIAIKPMEIIKLLMKMVDVENVLTGAEKKDIVIKVLTDISMGKDGIFGTADDLLPEHVVDGIVALIRSGIIDEVITLLHTVAITAIPPLGILQTLCKTMVRWLSKVL
jgi:hypothetical protein